MAFDNLKDWRGGGGGGRLERERRYNEVLVQLTKRNS